MVCVLCVFCNSARGHFSSVGTFTPTQNSLQMITTSSLDKGKNLTQAQLKVYRCYRVSHDKFPFYETVGNIWIYTYKYCWYSAVRRPAIFSFGINNLIVQSQKVWTTMILVILITKLFQEETFYGLCHHICLLASNKQGCFGRGLLTMASAISSIFLKWIIWL